MAKPWDKDLKFMVKAVIAAVVIMLFVHGVFYTYDPDAYTQVAKAEVESISISDEQVADYKLEMVAFDPHTLPAKLKAQKKPKTVLYVYTSWCPYCRKITPKMVVLQKQVKPEQAEFIFLSIDEDVDKLAEYLLSNRLNGAFKPYVASRPVLPVLQQMGASFKGHIPYIAVFDHKEMTLMESLGSEHFSSIERALGVEN